jgi:homocysteine S-methyltransferase
MALCSLIQQRTGRSAILHCTTRDHNRLSLQGLLWGARALGIETVLVTTGDFVALRDRGTTSDVRDIDLFGLLSMATEAGLRAGVVLDPHPESDGLPLAVVRLARKMDAGARFAVTKVAGIAVPQALRERMHRAQDPVAEGIAIARENLTLARERFAGACIMPPFDHYEILPALL